MNITTDIKTEHSRQLEKLNAEVLELRRLLRQLQRMASVGAMTAMVRTDTRYAISGRERVNQRSLPTSALYSSGSQ